MALANERELRTLPPEGHEVYRWPSDLANPDAGYVVFIDEATRQRRIKARAPEDAEEQRLSAKAEMRRTAMEAFRRTACLVPVEAITYRVAVNTILRDLETRGMIPAAKLFTASELDEIKPY
ncbi:hypothetical protein STCU_07397 [Strigomonas culicis]|uniref:Uncharacterized protein n=1 Tax=Strigomonas culicis TaxID=28005 RepID=S9TZC7_9TRYP|nr:hypothetical protein STCU_07397 [Strigomonas culicis]|eukprot:EPY23902.1 hypothetical protein STCU_07397 [Strigomonas culicis]